MGLRAYQAKEYHKAGALERPLGPHPCCYVMYELPWLHLMLSTG